jgi:tetratricopeptide (TPR) repeat protein
MKNPSEFLFWVMTSLVLCTCGVQPLAAQEAATADAAAEATATAEAVDIDKVMSDAQEKFVGGDMKEALELLETAIKQDPKNATLLAVAANGYTRYGVEMASDDRKAANVPLRRAAELMRTLKASKKSMSDQEEALFVNAIYNEACCAGVDGQADEASKLLREAVELGFDDVGQVENDSDFDAVRDNEVFRAVVSEME